MILVKDCEILYSLQGAYEKQGRRITASDLTPLDGVSVLVENGVVKWIGLLKHLPKTHFKKIKKEISAKNKYIIPGLVECHTHTVFAGQRAEEFELRNQGVSYQEISARGGGILSTRKAVQACSFEKLVSLTQKRVDRFIKQGVCTLEIKSGYGLDKENEIKSLKVLKKLKGVDIVPTFLGAHAIPKEFSESEKYLSYLIADVLPAIKKNNLSKRVDIFVENGFFYKDQARRYLKTFQESGFEIAIHADQLTLSGGSELAIEMKACSADHVIQISDREIKKLASSQVTCVLLPLADLYMKCSYPPARRLIDSGARVALSTDFNPGSCPSQDIAMVGLLARLEMKMTLAEILAAYTVGAAFALKRQTMDGCLDVGRRARFLLLEDDIWSLFYSSTDQQITHRFFDDRLEKLVQ